MRSLRALWMRLRGIFGAGRAEAEIRAEIESHLAMHIEDNLRAGMPAEEAQRQALIRLGGVEQTRQAWRDQRTLPWLESLGQDVKFALRQLRKSPGFAGVVVATLALGIGANTAIFSVVRAVLLEAPPYAKPGELVSLSESKAQAGITGEGMSYPGYQDLREHGGAFSAVAGLAGHSLTLTGHGEPSEVKTVVVTQDFFSLFGVQPLLGRTLTAKDGERGAAPVTVLSEALWRNKFGGDPGIVGRTITLDMRLWTVVGVMPAGFRTPFLDQAQQLWIPLDQDPLFSVWMTHPPRTHWMAAFARLRPGVSGAQAQAELEAVSAGLSSQFPEEKGWTIESEPLQKAIAGDVQRPLLVLLCAVGLVLLIACANIANLLLTRATSRSAEMAVRVALGASPRRLARQLLTESALLGLLGGAAGMAAAWWGVRALRSMLPQGLPQLHPVRVDGAVLGFALALSLVASLLFGLVPALFASRSDLQRYLREGGRGGESRGPQRARSVLAAAETALAMVLLVAAGLLIRSFARLSAVSPGFATAQVTRAMVSLPQFRYARPQQWAAFARELMQRLQAQPGMGDAAIAAPLPILDLPIPLRFDIVGAPPAPAGEAITADYETASPHYFRVMGIPLLQGRLFGEDDTASTPRVAVISEAFARRYFSGRNPLGQHIVFGFPPDGRAAREIVGVVGDIRDESLAKKPGPMMYVPFAQAPLWGGEVVVRSRFSAAAAAAAIERTTHSIDKDLPVTDIVSLPAGVDASVAQPRFRTALVGIFGAMALLLGAVGIFGVVSWSVSRRTREIGIRMALGAQRRNVTELMLSSASAPALAGIAAGALAAALLTRLMASLLYGVSAADPLTYAGSAALLLLVALVASYLPARRAASVDPVQALRAE